MKFRLDLTWRERGQVVNYPILMDVDAIRRLRGKGGLFERFLEVLPGFIKKNFETEGTRLGEQWQPLSSDYAQAKELKYPGNPTLVASGHMRMAATIPDIPGNWIQWTGNVMTYGIDITKFKGYYPASHQHGANIPAREIVPRQAKALHFFYKGKEVFAKRARPGRGRIPPRVFMGLAVDDLDELAKITANYMQEQIDKK